MRMRSARPVGATTLPARIVSRPAFTLVELLVAVLLIDVGVLAMVGGTAMIARRQVAMETRARAMQLASNRIQRLIAGPCAGSHGSTTSDGGVVEHWSADVTNGQRDLRDSVVFAVARAERNIVIRSRTVCRGHP